MSGRLPDDTELDALAAVARAVPRLSDAELERLLAEARDAPAGTAGTAGTAVAQVVEQTLGTVLQSVLARRGRAATSELLDLYQEGAVAATVAVGEFAARGAAASGLRRYVARVVDTFLDEVLEREAAQRTADALLVAQVELLQAAEVTLRRSLKRDPTTLELAALLQWEPPAVDFVQEALAVAAERHDLEILDYLDDADEDAEPG